MDALLRDAKTIAVVGLSAKPERASYQVAAYLQQHGYRVIAVNPSQNGAIILGEVCYATLQDAVAATGLKIDIVDCFRKSEDIAPIVEDAIAIGAACVWMQLDIYNELAATCARDAGLQVVMDKCIKIEHARRMAAQG